MTREEKCKLAIDKGFTYDEVTGKIYGVKGKEIKCKSTDGYIRIGLYISKKQYHLFGHQFSFYYKYGKVVDCIDHINGIKDDNRMCNLRSITQQENIFNKINKGYYFNKTTNKWHTQICFNYKNIYLGSYNTEQEARQVYLDAKQKYHII